MSARRSHEPDDDGAATVSIYWLRRELGRQDYGNTRLVAYVGLLIEQTGFPPPLPLLKVGRRPRGAKVAPAVADVLLAKVTLDSRWRRQAVEAWLTDFLPPGNTAQVETQARTAAAQQMDQAAARLRLVGSARA